MAAPHRGRKPGRWNIFEGNAVVNIAARKDALRDDALVRRRTASAGCPDAASLVLTHMAALPLSHPPSVVSGFWPVRGEIDPRPLMRHFANGGAKMALPVVEKPRAPLLFRLWNVTDELIPGVFDIPVPAADKPVVTPDLMLVPLLAFDSRGYRLGYGGGFYDRTIAALSQRGPLITIGIAFDGQQVDSVPHDGHDRQLDFIATERRIVDCRRPPTSPISRG